jgi:hypothetical protein
MMAVAAFHHSGSAAALTYKTNAVRYLSASLTPGHETSSVDLNQTQFAASMMLCIYSVSHKERSATGTYALVCSRTPGL